MRTRRIYPQSAWDIPPGHSPAGSPAGAALLPLPRLRRSIRRSLRSLQILPYLPILTCRPARPQHLQSRCLHQLRKCRPQRWIRPWPFRRCLWSCRRWRLCHQFWTCHPRLLRRRLLRCHRWGLLRCRRWRLLRCHRWRLCRHASTRRPLQTRYSSIRQQRSCRPHPVIPLCSAASLRIRHALLRSSLRSCLLSCLPSRPSDRQV